MPLDLPSLLSFLGLGALVGFVAGLLGVGGGGIMVPILTAMFLSRGIPVDKVVHLALGTSMASIIATSIASLRAHHARGNINWGIVKAMSPGIVLGTFLATCLAVNARSFQLAVFFSLFMAYVSAQMFFDRKPEPGRRLAGESGLLLAGAFIGAISALVSIGGGSLTVPYLVWQNLDIRKAIGTSAAIGLPISLAGTAGYVANGWSMTPASAHALGFVYVPAVVLIAMASSVTAPHGARLAHRLPVRMLKRVFASLLIVLSLKMLLSVL